MAEPPKLSILLPWDSPWLDIGFTVDGEDFFVRNVDGRWVFGREAEGPNAPPVSAVEVARGLNEALRQLERRRLPEEPPVEQP